MKCKFSVVAALCCTLLPLAAQADWLGDHPGYLHALSDLRAARWNLEHRPGDAAVSEQENIAISEIDHAIDEVKKAAAEDGKNLEDHPHEDANLNHSGRLHHALELLQKAHADMDHEEDNPEAHGLRHRALEHVDHAMEAAHHAIHDVEKGR